MTTPISFFKQIIVSEGKAGMLPPTGGGRMSTRTSSTSTSGSQSKGYKTEEEQMAELREIFRSFDGNKDDSLTQVELGSLLRSLGVKPSHHQLQALIRKVDTNHNGLVELSEFVALVKPDLNLVQPQACIYRQDQLRNMFRLFDRDGNGYISPAELTHSMAKLGHPLTAEELIGMMDEADTDRDGRIDFDEFSRAINSAAFLNK